MNGIIGLLKIDETHFEDKALIRENHKKMKIAADYLLSLINDVLQMSKIEEGHIVLTHEYMGDPNAYDQYRYTYFIPLSMSIQNGYSSFEPMQDWWMLIGK